MPANKNASKYSISVKLITFERIFLKNSFKSKNCPDPLYTLRGTKLLRLPLLYNFKKHYNKSSKNGYISVSKGNMIGSFQSFLNEKFMQLTIRSVE